MLWTLHTGPAQKIQPAMYIVVYLCQLKTTAFDEKRPYQGREIQVF